jgi:hypothetical protein
MAIPEAFSLSQVRSSANQGEYQSVTFSDHYAYFEKIRKALGKPISIATGSRRSKTQELFPFGYFGIPFL